MIRKLTVTEENRISVYMTKLFSADKDKTIKDVAVAAWSIGTAYLRVYVIFKAETAIPKEITDILDRWAEGGLTGTDSKLTISAEFDDDALPNDLTYLYRNGEPVTS